MWGARDWVANGNRQGPGFLKISLTHCTCRAVPPPATRRSKKKSARTRRNNWDQGRPLRIKEEANSTEAAPNHSKDLRSLLGQTPRSFQQHKGTPRKECCKGGFAEKRFSTRHPRVHTAPRFPDSNWPGPRQILRAL